MSNKDRFMELLDHIERKGYRKELLIKQLEISDFFVAPATTSYHHAYEGGLVEHVLNVYDNLVAFNTAFNLGFDEESMIIVALFHDFSRMNKYISTPRNKKIYSEDGEKSDALGNYDWVTVMEYSIKDPSERFIFGNEEATSVYMTNTFIQLTLEEQVAISHYKGGQGWDSSKENILEIYKAYPLAMYLYMSDLKDVINE